MHILSVYIFQVGVNQQLYGWACSCWPHNSHNGANVKFHQVELDSWRQINVHLSVTINYAVKNSVLRLILILMIKVVSIVTSCC